MPKKNNQTTNQTAKKQKQKQKQRKQRLLNLHRSRLLNISHRSRLHRWTTPVETTPLIRHDESTVVGIS